MEELIVTSYPYVYGTEQIDVGAGSLILRVRGRELTLRSMTDSELRIFGKIDAVEYVR